MPVYNTKDTLERCLNSLNHPDINVVAVDDGSIDGSSELLDKYKKQNQSMTVIHTENNGASFARTTGLSYVNTPYFSFADSDDYIKTKPYVNLASTLEETGYKIGNGRTCVHLAKPFSKIPLHSRRWHLERVDFMQNKTALASTTCTLWDKIFHKDLIKYFETPTDSTIYEDLEYTYHALASEGKMLHTNQIIYNYCMRRGSTSAKGLNMQTSAYLKGLLEAFENMKTKFEKSDLYQTYEDELIAIETKLIFQRILAVFNNKNIENKKEIAAIILNAFTVYNPNWQNNPENTEKHKYNAHAFRHPLEAIINSIPSIPNTSKKITKPQK